MLDKVTKIFYNTIHEDVYGTFKSGQNSIENPNPGDIWPCPIYKKACWIHAIHYPMPIFVLSEVHGMGEYMAQFNWHNTDILLWMK